MLFTHLLTDNVRAFVLTGYLSNLLPPHLLTTPLPLPTSTSHSQPVLQSNSKRIYDKSTDTFLGIIYIANPLTLILLSPTSPPRHHTPHAKHPSTLDSTAQAIILCLPHPHARPRKTSVPNSYNTTNHPLTHSPLKTHEQPSSLARPPSLARTSSEPSLTSHKKFESTTLCTPFHPHEKRQVFVRGRHFPSSHRNNPLKKPDRRSG